MAATSEKYPVGFCFGMTHKMHRELKLLAFIERKSITHTIIDLIEAGIERKRNAIDAMMKTSELANGGGLD